MRKTPRNHKQRMRKLRRDRLAKGLCQMCGEVPFEVGTNSCADCKAARRFKYSQEKEDLIILVIEHCAMMPTRAALALKTALPHCTKRELQHLFYIE